MRGGVKRWGEKRGTHTTHNTSAQGHAQKSTTSAVLFEPTAFATSGNCFPTRHIAASNFATSSGAQRSSTLVSRTGEVSTPSVVRRTSAHCPHAMPASVAV